MGSSTNGRSRQGVRRRRGSSPRLPDRPTVPEVIPLIECLWGIKGCGVGGPLHAVIDDGNLKDGHIQWAIDHAHEVDWWSEEAANLGIEIARRMLQMTGTQRRKLADHNYYRF